MKVPFIDLSRQTTAIRKALEAAFEQTIGASFYVGGKAVENFEKAFAQFTRTSYCIGCNSGTDGLEIALRSLDIGKGHEVIVAVNTCIAAAEAIRITGAHPVFVDVSVGSFLMDLNETRSKITENTKAIMVTHLYGEVVDMTGYRKLAEDNNLSIIEDCSHTHGADAVSKLSDISVYSFYPTKNLGALGDAGALVTDNPDLAEKARLWTDHGQKSKDKHEAFGRNSRLDSLQASFLLAKLSFLEDWNRMRKENAEKYRAGLSDLPLELPTSSNGTDHVYHQFVIGTGRRDELKKFLEEEGIQTQIHYPYLIPGTPPFLESNLQARYPNAYDNLNKILSLPVFPYLRTEEVQTVSKAIDSFFC